MRRFLCTTVAVVLVVAAGGCSRQRPASAVAPPFAIDGQIRIVPGEFLWNVSACVGKTDMKSGAEVVVTNASRAEIAHSRLTGQPVEGGGTGPQKFCVMSFAVPNVPAGEGPYGIEVARHGRFQFTEEQVKSRVTLTYPGYWDKAWF